MAKFMMTSSTKLDRLQKVGQLTIDLFNPKLIAIAFLTIGYGSIDLSVMAQTPPENSADVLLEPEKTDTQEKNDLSETQTELSIDSEQKRSARISDIIEVNPRSQQWENIHSGDMSTGTIRFRLNR